MFLAISTKHLHALLEQSQFPVGRLGYFTRVSFPQTRQLLTLRAGEDLIPEHAAACSSWGPQNLHGKQKRKSGPPLHTSTWQPHSSVPCSRHPNWDRWQSKDGFNITQVLNKHSIRKNSISQKAGDCGEERIHEWYDSWVAIADDKVEWMTTGSLPPQPIQCQQLLFTGQLPPWFYVMPKHLQRRGSFLHHYVQDQHKETRTSYPCTSVLMKPPAFK